MKSLVRLFSTVKDPRNASTFTDLGVSTAKLGPWTPTEVQKKMLAVATAGGSVLARSAPGTGKSTAALLALKPGESALKNLILVPTNALAGQTLATLNQLGVPATGLFRTGEEAADEDQHKLLKGASTLVATPNRVLDYLSFDASLLPVQNLTNVVVDELDVFQQRSKKITPLETLLRHILETTASAPILTLITSSMNALSFAELPAILESARSDRPVYEVSVAPSQSTVKVTLLDPLGQPMTHESFWKHKRPSTAAYVEALERVWAGDGIVVLAPGASLTEFTEALKKKHGLEPLVVQATDISGINVPDLDRLYVIGWDDSYDLHKLAGSLRKEPSELRIALDASTSPGEATKILQEMKALA